MKILIKDRKHLVQAARQLLHLTSGKKIFAFYGPMGAGKTTLIKTVCKLLEAEDTVTSPTFTLVNEYRTTSGDSLFHFDFYRINKLEEVYDFGIEEYLSSESYCFMEWPELIEEILPPETVKVRITVGENEERILEL